MNKLQVAAEKAIDALSHFATDESKDGWIAIEAINCLREALEEELVFKSDAEEYFSIELEKFKARQIP